MSEPVNTEGRRDYLNEFRLLSTVHRLFSQMQHLVGQTIDDLSFDTHRLESDIHRLRSSEPNEDREIDIEARLTVWRQVLEKFDAIVSVANLRRHFEQAGLPKSHSLELILSFYLSKTAKSAEDRDKTDLIVTRWGRLAFQTRENETLLLPAPSLRERLEKLYTTLGLTILSPQETREACENLEQERKQLLTVRSLRELIGKQVLIRMRKIKEELGEIFYQPVVLNEVVAINISLHNVFQDLFLSEQARHNNFLQEEGEKKVTNADQVLASMIERPKAPPAEKAKPVMTREAPAPADKSGSQVLLDREELLDTIRNMRSMLSLLDQHLQDLTEKLTS